MITQENASSLMHWRVTVTSAECAVIDSEYISLFIVILITEYKSSEAILSCQYYDDIYCKPVY
jgi:hypothetical protein